MKAVLPILICSAISAGLGYYFGHITIPPGALAGTSGGGTSGGYSAPANGGSQATPGVPAPAPAQNFAEQVAPQAIPTQPAPVAAPVAPVAPVAAPAASVAAAATVPAAPATAQTAVFDARAAKPVQTLTDTQGRTINASIVEVTDQNVKIKRTDGLLTQIPLSMLSPDDVAFCNYLREQQKEKEAAAPPPVKTDGFDWDAYFNS